MDTLTSVEVERDDALNQLAKIKGMVDWFLLGEPCFKCAETLRVRMQNSMAPMIYIKEANETL